MIESFSGRFPFEGLKLPEQNSAERVRCFTADGMRQIIEAAGEPFRSSTGLRQTGIRMGEFCGLKWESIDFNRSIVQIRRTSGGAK